jgi:hypothetical protein
MIAAVQTNRGLCIVQWTGRGAGFIPSVETRTYCKLSVPSSDNGVWQLHDSGATCEVCKAELARVSPPPTFPLMIAPPLSKYDEELAAIKLEFATLRAQIDDLKSQVRSLTNPDRAYE